MTSSPTTSWWPTPLTTCQRAVPSVRSRPSTRLAGAEVEDELLEDALGELPGVHDPDLSGPDEDDVEAWLDEGAAG